MSKKIVIVGGVAGGASTATRLRRLSEDAEIVVFERGQHASFSNCCLPYYLSRTVPNASKLVMLSPEDFKKRFNIEMKVRHEVKSIDRDAKEVLVKNLETGEEFRESYDVLVLSPGASPLRPRSLKGSDLDHVFTLRNVTDVTQIDAFTEESDVKRVCVVGGGFIGVEVAENLIEAGKEVVLVEAGNQVMQPLDIEMAQILHKTLLDHGVDLKLNQKVVEIKEDSVLLESGEEVPAEAVILAMGVRPEVQLAKEAGLKIGETGGIAVDDHYRTEDDSIYALGDAIEVENELLEKKSRLALAGPAQKQARDVADDIMGREVHPRGVIGSSVVKVFEWNAASTGLNEKQLQEMDLDYGYSFVISSDKVSLMPHANSMFFKLLFEKPSGRILGAQAVGQGNVDKRIDVIATVIHFGGSLEDVRRLELVYAPPFGTAKDVIQHAALNGLNLLNGEIKQVCMKDVRELVKKGACIVDVREPGEWACGHIKGAINIPLSQFRERLDEFPKDRPIYLHCRSGQRSYFVLRALQQMGYDVYNIAGSFLGLSYYEYFTDVTEDREPIVTEYNFR